MAWHQEGAPWPQHSPVREKKSQKDPRSRCHFHHQGPHSLHQSRPELTELHCAPLEKELLICVPHSILAPLHTSSNCHKHNSPLVHMPQKWSCHWSLYDCTPDPGSAAAHSTVSVSLLLCICRHTRLQVFGHSTYTCTTAIRIPSYSSATWSETGLQHPSYFGN